MVKMKPEVERIHHRLEAGDTLDSIVNDPANSLDDVMTAVRHRREMQNRKAQEAVPGHELMPPAKWKKRKDYCLDGEPIHGLTEDFYFEMLRAFQADDQVALMKAYDLHFKAMRRVFGDQPKADPTPQVVVPEPVSVVHPDSLQPPQIA